MMKIEDSFQTSVEKIKYLFDSEFNKKIELILLEFHPEFVDGELKNYEITVEFDIVKDVDPDLDYLFREYKNWVDKISSFFNQFRINSKGGLKKDFSDEKIIPVVASLDYLFGEKLILGVFFSFHN